VHSLQSFATTTSQRTSHRFLTSLLQFFPSVRSYHRHPLFPFSRSRSMSSLGERMWHTRRTRSCCRTERRRSLNRGLYGLNERLCISRVPSPEHPTAHLLSASERPLFSHTSVTVLLFGQFVSNLTVLQHFHPLHSFHDISVRWHNVVVGRENVVLSHHIMNNNPFRSPTHDLPSCPFVLHIMLHHDVLHDVALLRKNTCPFSSLYIHFSPSGTLHLAQHPSSAYPPVLSRSVAVEPENVQPQARHPRY
jgi:hypothetical protein